MALDIILTIFLLVIVVIKALLVKNTKDTALVKTNTIHIEEDLTFILETLNKIATEITKIKEWIRSLELERESAQDKKESGG